MIEKLLPRTAYERESLIKSLLLFFLTMELFLGVITYLTYRGDLLKLRNTLFLELKNFSYTFEGEKFTVDIVPAKKGQRFYELFEDRKGLYILVPVPVSEKDVLRITYPAEKFSADVGELRKKSIVFFSLSSLVALILSTIFSLYALNPLRKALNIIEEVTRDIIHDINTPLMTLMINLKILSKKYKDEEIERSLLALKQLQTLKENLRPLLLKTELRLSDLNIKEIVQQELKDLRRLFPDREVIADLQDVTLRADDSAVRRTVSNILENAFKYSEGWVKISLSPEALTVQNPSKPVKNPSKLFDRYYRESQRGIGIGLSIVRKLCSEMGWGVEANYEKGLFTIKISFKR